MHIDAHGIINHEHDPDRTDFLFRISLKAVVLNKKGEVLVVKETGRSCWDLPGGGMDHGESVEQALARELREEVSLEADFTYEPIFVEDPTYLEKHSFYQMRIVLLVMPDQFNFAPGDDGDEAAFMEPAQLKDSMLMTERSVYKYYRLAVERGLIK